ncbi:MAG: right-handed parallel beta-helix repeat-containing protein [Bacteroidetes bacterium]|nr:right-handed parallel beta-helix repeat-containing protein [Bacteroidota bacterium]
MYTKYNWFILALVVALAACHKAETVNVSKALVVTSHPITSDSLKGSISGTLLSGKTYYFSADITINAKDTLLMQAGSRLIAVGSASPQITCNGTFISLGTEDNNNYITVPDAQRTFANAGKGYWGGIQCGESSGDLILKWTHFEFAGGPAGQAADLNVFAPGDPRNNLSYTNINGNVIIEDCWFYGSQDDGMRILHGKVSLMRNTFEDCGTTGGEAVNLKNGVVGDVGYNLVIGAATNAFKISNSGGGPIENKTYLYNNTMLNSGFRQLKSGRGGSIDYEKGASGKIYNNVIVNCRFGMRLTGDADITNIAYNNQQFYGNDISLTSQFYSVDGVGKAASADILGAPKANNPKFKVYDVDQFDYSAVKPPLAQSAMPQAIVTVSGGYDFGLLASSPGYQKGTTSFKAQRTVPQGGDFGATTLDPNADMGAYPTDGTGNKHFTSSLTSAK